MMTNWTNYIDDLQIPKNWVCTSYGNDALPSYQTQEDNHKAYHIWMDSHDLEERKRNAKDIYGSDTVFPRFCICLCYGYEGDYLFETDNFQEVVDWVENNPKTKEEIELTKKYV